MLDEIYEKLKNVFTEEGKEEKPELVDTIEGVTLELDGTAKEVTAKVIAKVEKATAGVKSYKFEYKLSTEEEYKLDEEIECEELTCAYTYNNLTSGKENNLRVTVIDNKDNMLDATLDVTPTNKWDNYKLEEVKTGDGQIIPKPVGTTILNIEAKIDDGIIMQDSKQNQWVWVPIDTETCNSMFVESKTPIALKGNIGVTTTKYSASNILSRVSVGSDGEICEPDLVLGRGSQYDYLNYGTAGFSSLKDMATNLVNDYEKMIDSIKKYGGFYIGRYELSNNGVKANQIPATGNWYTLYKQCKTLTPDETKGITRMIWGCQWDVMCKWIAKNNNIKDSSSYGNYLGVDVYNSDRTSIIKEKIYQTKLNTGITRFTMINNIYDLARKCV